MECVLNPAKCIGNLVEDLTDSQELAKIAENTAEGLKNEYFDKDTGETKKNQAVSDARKALEPYKNMDCSKLTDLQKQEISILLASFTMAFNELGIGDELVKVINEFKILDCQIPEQGKSNKKLLAPVGVGVGVGTASYLLLKSIMKSSIVLCHIAVLSLERPVVKRCLSISKSGEVVGRLPYQK